MRSLLISISVAAIILGASGCAGRESTPTPREPMLSELPFVYKMTVQQGNLLTEERIAQLTPGMTATQVRYLLGTPLLTHLFRSQRWDYIYTIRRRHQPMEIKQLTLYFDQEILARIETDRTLPPPETLDELAERDQIVEVPDWQDNRGLVRQLLNRFGATAN